MPFIKINGMFSIQNMTESLTILDKYIMPMIDKGLVKEIYHGSEGPTDKY